MDQPIASFHQDELGDWVARLACGHHQHVRHDDIELRVGLEVCDLARELAGMPPIVLIEKSDQLAAGRVDARVARRGRAAIGLSNDAHPTAAGGQDRRALVRRSVVHRDDLDRRVLLREDALERVAQVGGAVVDGQDAADERRGHAFQGMSLSPGSGGSSASMSMRR